MKLRPLAWHLAVLIAVVCTMARSQAKERIFTGKTEKLPTVGIEIKSFRDFETQPWPGTHAVTVENMRTGEKADAYDTRELWVTDQVRGLFKHAVGRVVIAELALQVPPDDMPTLDGKLVIEAAYRTAMQDRAMKKPKGPDLKAWVEYFTNETVEAEIDKVKEVQSPYPYRSYTFKGRDAERFRAFVVLANRSGDVYTYVMVLYDFDEKLDILDSDSAMARSFSTLRWIGRKAAEQGPNSAMQLDRGKRQVRSPAYEATRQRVIANIGNLKDWWYVELPSYILTSNMDTRSRQLVTMIQEDMEPMRATYARYIPELQPIEEVSVIRVFAERKEYQSYVPASFEWSSGIWMPGKKELVISPIDMGNKRDSRSVMLSVVYHEGFHQYLHYALGGVDTPIWFNEGHAAFFEGADITRQRVQIGEVEMRIRRIEEMYKWKGKFHLKQLFAMSQSEFYGEGIEHNYSRAYGVIYFLRKAAPFYPGRGYETLCDTIVEAVADSKGDMQAVNLAIAKAVDIDRFEADLLDFWANNTKRTQAARNHSIATKPVAKPANKPPVGD